MEKIEEKITPSQYFDLLKDAKQNITTDELKNSYEIFLKLGEKYNKLGQTESLKKLCFLADTLKKEEKIINLGVTTYIYRDVIEDYIENVADKTVKIVELSRYTREIPDEFIEVIENTKEFFDEFYVVFTDYTGIEERKVEKEKRDKDPILFGVFKNERNVSDRFYFLGDWIDEYCDLTLDKMIEQYKEKKGYSPTIENHIPKTSEELLSILQSYNIDNNKDKIYGFGDTMSVDGYIRSNKNSSPKRNNIFTKIRTIFHKK